MKVLLLSAYDGASHRYWRQGLETAFPEYSWTVLTLPGYYFSWRIRGNPLSWLYAENDALRCNYDLIVATSMVDLATLKGLYPNLAVTPSVCYFHENQFEYPSRNQGGKTLEPSMVNLYSALASNRILFNSRHNRDSFFQGADKLMKQLPDYRPRPVSALMTEKSSIVPVPLADELKEYQAINQSASFTVDWNHRWQCICNGAPIKIAWAARWEHDKGPDRLLAVMRELEHRRVDYRICVLGEEFRDSPPEFQMIKDEFRHRLVQAGFVESKDEYYHWLASADLFLSTSIHEFQGLSALEGIALGCVPVLPERMSYPELVSSEYLYESCMEDILKEAHSAAGLIESFVDRPLRAPRVDNLFWRPMKAKYQREFKACAEVSNTPLP